ncbi:GNAT family N-acetyltransferase [Novosphingobium sp.]|uniref:GNAT family N-acetyltransferase n=1 Tax=Novosphingobium sp. TaxID=1874826 RepID=UPI002733D664|nr:GNAT family N-acetyltransferase [Novosphingobium sp.]MDP3906979.1 GNAT family N-acetyltransferase [Novosphingobium sp.]
MIVATQALRAPLAEPQQEAAAIPLPAPIMRTASWSSFDAPDARAAWDKLAQRASEPNPFFESWYLLPALRTQDPDQSVTLLCAEQNGALIGLLPIRLERRYYQRPVPHLASWHHPNCFLGAPLVAAGQERPFWQALLEWADRNPGSGLFLHLPQLPLAGPLYAALIDELRAQGRFAALVHREDRAMLASDLSADAYLEAALSGKKRKELRRQFARLSELGDIQFERRTDAAGLERWVDDFLALEHSGWKGAAGSALASHHATTLLFREGLAGAAAHGRLERLTLTLDGEPIAMLASFLTPPGAFSYKTAFDERFSRFSPGVLLQRENLAMLDHPAVRWTDSCAAADHPMIDHIWRERRAIGRVSIAIGGPLRRFAFRLIAKAELGRNPAGLTP